MIKGYQNIRPVYQKESMTASRTSRLTAIVLAFNLILAVVGLLQLQMMVKSSRYYGETEYVSLLEMFSLVASFEAAFVLFIVPALTAGSISGERERQTLDLLLCTRLRPIDIVIGKLFSCLSTVFVLIVSSLPVLSLVYICGGIGLMDLGKLFVCLAVTTLYIGSISIFFSSTMKRTTTATVMSYLTVIFTVAGTFLLLVMVYKIYEMVALENMAVTEIASQNWNLLLLINPAMMFFSLFQQLLGSGDLQYSDRYHAQIMTDQLTSPWWIWCSCLVQLLLSVLFVWLASRAICPLRRKRE